MAEALRLSLTEYSNKYSVSISTLRRRIKAGNLDFIMDEGKYKLLDASFADHKRMIAQRTADRPVSLAPPQKNQGHGSLEEGSAIHTSSKEMPEPESQVESRTEPEGSVLSTAKEILGELKKAYAQILQEKEEQILLLKEELADMKTLVSVLEEQNERLRKNETTYPKINDWLDNLPDM